MTERIREASPPIEPAQHTAAKVAGFLCLVTMVIPLLAELYLRVFTYLWLKSRYIPRGLAAWGIFSSLALAIGILALMVFPGLASVVGPAYWLPIFIFEVTLGFWLLVKRIRAPIVE